MIIKNIKIENFTVFKDLKVDFTDGINIIIGENGTGKTHLLKLLYGTQRNLESKKVNASYDNDFAKDYFRTDYDSLCNDKNLDMNVNVEFKYLVDKEVNENKKIFIPAKEMLSHSKGFLALNNKYDMPFDKTYVDIITNAELPEVKKVSPLNQMILDKISKIINGKVIYENDTFYILSKENKKIEFSLEAEGLRKFGLFYKLIKNGLIEKDSILFWDEPESNINPELIPILVDILLLLKKEGVQIFISTHSYNLAKYFEIKIENEDDVFFINLYKTNDGVQQKSDKYFGELENNAIIKADSKLLDSVIEESFED